MTRLVIQVEGQTEETFVNRVLASHLLNFGYTSVRATFIGSPRTRGGICAWPRARRGLIAELKSDPHVVVTTMVDYYGLPSIDQNGWPGRQAAAKLSPALRGASVEKAVLADLQSELGSDYNLRRFVPFVVMHEFEGLLFSDCVQLCNSIKRPKLIPKFQKIRDAFGSPEEINDSPQTAPSKRVLHLVPEYTKPFFGVIAVIDIGLDTIRRECPHFHDWLERLESLPAQIQE